MQYVIFTENNDNLAHGRKGKGPLSIHMRVKLAYRLRWGGVVCCYLHAT